MIAEKLKVIIVEDEVLISKHIESTLNANNFQVLGIAHDSETALDYIHSRSPDLVILDIHIDGSRDGIDVAEIINSKYKIPFLFLTAFSDVTTLDRAKAMRPCAYIVKPFKPKDLITSITIGLYNFEERENNKSVDLKWVNSFAAAPLSNKEFEVLMDIKEGLTNAQIARKQFLSLSTIKFHSKNIYQKLDVQNRASAIGKITRID